MTKPILIDLPFPIYTPRLLLRPTAPGDGAEVFEATQESIEELKPWFPFVREGITLEKSEESCRRAYANFILREDLRIQIYDRTTQKLIGSSGLHRCNWEHRIFMIGYWVRKSQAGKGYITESTNALTQYAFRELKATRLEIRCNSSNLKSRAIPERLHFPFEGTLKNIDYFAAQNISCLDEVFYARTDLKNLPELDVQWETKS